MGEVEKTEEKKNGESQTKVEEDLEGNRPGLDRSFTVHIRSERGTF
jgi:hypothetical protein